MSAVWPSSSGTSHLHRARVEGGNISLGGHGIAQRGIERIGLGPRLILGHYAKSGLPCGRLPRSRAGPAASMPRRPHPARARTKPARTARIVFQNCQAPE